MRFNTCNSADAGPCGPTSHRYSLTCDPAAGSLPRPNAACTALADLRMPTRPGVRCGTIVGKWPNTDARTTVSGTLRGARVALTITPDSWCGASRKQMRDYWTLSAFPCYIVVNHSYPGRVDKRFAEASGCHPRLYH